MADRRTFVITGGGLAGAKAAETLRAEGFDGRLVLVCAEPELPYERPPLSKGYLAGATTLADARVHDRAFYAGHEVELVMGVAAEVLDPGAHRLGLAYGATLAYDRLLVATGAVPRRPPIPGVEVAGVQVLRTVADADRLREVIARRGRVAVVGAGWIGSEVAATARTRGADVILIEQARVPLQHVLGERIGAFLAEVHRSHGVELIAGEGVARVEEGPIVVLAGGRRIEADAVVLGVGVAPATGLATAAGLQVDDGIVTDAHLRTSAPDVFAAGDVASAFHPRYGRHVRVEHWANAAGQGAAAARSMLGGGDAYAAIPFFFSDQYELGLEYFGRHAPDDRLVVRGSLDDGRFQAFWLGERGTVTAGMHVDDWDAADPIRRLVDLGARVDPRSLSDAGRALEDLIAAAPRAARR